VYQFFSRRHYLRNGDAEDDTRIVCLRQLARVSKHKALITEQAQSKPTTELCRESRLFRIAKALASGAAVTDIAEAEGMTAPWHRESELAGVPATDRRVRRR
jgi:hypothetical protein